MSCAHKEMPKFQLKRCAENENILNRFRVRVEFLETADKLFHINMKVYKGNFFYV